MAECSDREIQVAHIRKQIVQASTRVFVDTPIYYMMSQRVQKMKRHQEQKDAYKDVYDYE